MIGQWIGVVSGTNNGTAILNIEGASYGRLLFTDFDGYKLSIMARVDVDN